MAGVLQISDGIWCAANQRPVQRRPGGHSDEEEAGLATAGAAAGDLKAAQPQRGQQVGAELGVLPAVDEDVDAGVEDQQEVRAV